MKAAALSLLAGLGLLHAATEGLFTARGLGLSLGRGRVTARITFDRQKAAGGGYIFATPGAGPEDEEAVRMSEAVVTTSGGLWSRAAVTAREHRVPAVIIGRARWDKGPALLLEAPILGEAKKGPEGITFRLVENTLARRVSEGDVVAVDPAPGSLTLYPLSAQPSELELAQALRAYDGLKDPQSLVQWLAGKAAENPDSAPLAGRLLEELAGRVAAGAAKADDFRRLKNAIEAALSAPARKDLRAGQSTLLAREAAKASAELAEILESVREAGTTEAAVRLESRARVRWEALRSIAEALGAQPEPGAAASYSAVEKLFRARIGRLRAKRTTGLMEAVSEAGGSVPESVVLSSDVYRRFVEDSGLAGPIEDLGGDASLELRRKSERIEALILSVKLTADSPLGREILGRLPPAQLYRVAGAQESRTVPADQVLRGVQEGWASFWSPAPLGARKRRGLPLQPETRLTIERMTPAEVSGVLFTREPASASAERLIVDAVFGDIEGLLNAQVSSDQYVLDRQGREVLPALIADKREKFEYDPVRKALALSSVPEGTALSRCLTGGELKRLARVGRALENHFGYGLEVGFSFAGDRLLILSARPIAQADS